MRTVVALALTFIVGLPAGRGPAPRGYAIHITRASHWTESSAHPITLNEWVAYVRSDSEMRLDSSAESTNGAGDRLVYRAPGIAVWTKWAGGGVGGGQAWFYYEDGAISAKDPDPAILKKAYRIAVVLNARLQGDDGELYGANGEVVSR